MRRDDTPASMPTKNRPRNAGTSLNDDASRLDGPAKVTGAAKYSRDVYPPGCLFAAYVVCPYGKATLESRDEAAARAVPGVVEVQINADADTKAAQYHGATVGHILAESPLAVKRALRALRCVWKEEPCRTSITDEALPAPEPSEATRSLLEGAAHVLEAEYSTPVQPHCCLESHGGCVVSDGETAKAYISTQGTFAAAGDLDNNGIARSKYEVICDYIGGGFGSKLNGAGKEGTLAFRLAVKHKRPVWLFRNRKEDQTDTGNRPSALARVRFGVAKDGSILGGLVQKFGGTGVSARGGGMAFPSGRYALGEVQQSHTDVRFNGGGPRPARAPGHPQGSFIEEMAIEECAALAGADPLDLRRRLDTSEARREMLDLGAKLIGWHRRLKSPALNKTIRTGFGVAACSWHSGGGGANCEVVISRDGSVEARSGTQDIGTGQRTVMGICAAEALGVPLRLVTSRVGSSSLPQGPGSGGSVTTPSTAPPMIAAGKDARARFIEALAQSLSVDPGAVEIADGKVAVKGGPTLSWKEACAKMPGDQIVGRANRGEGGRGHTDGVQFVELEVDTETGNVHVVHVVAIQSCGRVIFRKGAESQIIGSVIQGISYALYETQVLDRRHGSMLNANMEWYKILGPADMPHIEPVLWTKGQTAPRSMGEPPAIPTAAAIGCAVFNALGAPVRSLPITPDRVLAAIAGARK